MADTTFRISTPTSDFTTEKTPDPEPNEYGGIEDISDLEPVEDVEEVVLNALGIDDEVRNLASEDLTNLKNTAGYVEALVKAKGLPETVGSFKKMLNQLKGDMGLDADAAPDTVLERIGGVVKAWQGLSFITDSNERRLIFFKLAKLDSVESMNKLVFHEMEKRKVWV